MRKIYPIVLAMILLVSCPDSKLKQVSKGLLISAKALGTVQTTVIEADRQGLITKDTTRKILEGCVRANYAGQQAIAITRTISKLDPDSQQRMIPLVRAALSSISATLMIDMTGVTDERTKLMVTTGLATAQTALNTTLLLLTNGG